MALRSTLSLSLALAFAACSTTNPTDPGGPGEIVLVLDKPPA